MLKFNCLNFKCKVIDCKLYRNQDAPHMCSNGLIRHVSMIRSFWLSGIEHKIFCNFSLAICPVNFEIIK